MKIEKIELNNFRSVKNITFEFKDKLNLFIGVNGAGKSTILDALSICLSWLVKRIEKENGRGFYIPDSSLSNGENKGFLDFHISRGDVKDFRWYLTKILPKSFIVGSGRAGDNLHSTLDLKSQFSGANRLAKEIRQAWKVGANYPVIAYYSVDRVVNTISPEPSDPLVNGLSIYANALGGGTNFKYFFEWFRRQDDIVNQKSNSHSTWMRQNYSWMKNKIDDLLNLLKKSKHNDIDSIQEEFMFIIKRFDQYDEPGYITFELIPLIHQISTSLDNNKKELFHDLEYVFHKINLLKNENKDDFSKLYSKVIEQFITHFINLQKDTDKKLMTFIWEAFSFSLLLSFWWLSEIGRNKLEKQLESYKKKLDIEKINKNKDFSSILRKIIKDDVGNCKDTSQKKMLNVIRKAIEAFIPEYNNLRIEREPYAHMVIDKNNESFDLNQLSDGEKNLLALVGDIARRLAIGNYHNTYPLDGDGIILIDEIDLHLHPKWQRLVVPKLLEIFPNCQFFISTHSPQILSHVNPENIFLLEQSDKGLSYRKPDETYGMSLDRIVELIMNDECRPESVKESLDTLFELIERGKIEEAKKLVRELKQDLKTDPEIMRAEMLIRQEKKL